MNLPLVLDVIISLIFIYLVLSLLASELQELLATLLQWRAKHLKDSIANLIAGGTGDTSQRFVGTKVGELVDEIYDNPLIKNVNQEARGAFARGVRAITHIFPNNRKHSYGTNQSTGPSYIGSDTFATALVERFGLTSLVDRLIDNRLEQFVQRIIGDVVIYDDVIQLRDPSTLPGVWDLAARHGVDLGYDLPFRGLVEDYQAILKDYRQQTVDRNTCVAQLAEALDRYISTAASDPRQRALVERVKALKQSLFGDSNERILRTAGLQPTMQEVANLLDRGSTTSRELIARYDNMRNQAESITQYAADRAKALRSYAGDEQADLAPFMTDALAELNDTEYRIYQDYHTYHQVTKAINRLPDSLRQSMVMLGHRAQSTAQQTGDTISAFRTEVAQWFDNSMNRASGVYKRNAKGTALMIGFLIAAFTNADTFHMLNRISSDESLREVVTRQAAQIQENAQARNGSTPLRPGQIAQELEIVRNETDQVLSDMALPLTWSPSNLSRQLGCPYSATVSGSSNTNGDQETLPYALINREQWNQLYRACLNRPNASVTGPAWMQVLQMINVKPFAFFRMLCGWLISGIAIGMGAPFWFDLLGRVVNVRNTGAKP
ncbi:MAG: hypothetical protein RLZZ511_625 [Cyanobacteriota bacterium]